MCREIVRPRAWLAAVGAAALALPVSASASPVLVFRDGRALERNDLYLPSAAFSDQVETSPAPSIDSRAGARLTARAARGPSVYAVLRAALREGRIAPDAYTRYRTIYKKARSAHRRLKGRCGHQLGVVLRSAERLAHIGSLYSNRMPAVFLELQRNTTFWRAKPKIAASERVTFPPGETIFQHYPGQGLRIQQLASFGKANGLWTACTTGRYTCHQDTLAKLLDDQVSIASLRGPYTAWEYYFYFDGGNPPWASGMAQGTAMQALARGTQLTGNPSYASLAHEALGAFRLRPPTGVRIKIDGGNHYLQYTFAPRVKILNAFLQSLIGLYDYAQISGDPDAQAAFAAGDVAAQREVPRYDTGSWSHYSIPGSKSSWDYHDLVTTFLKNLCDRTGADVYCRTAEKFAFYETEHPKPPPGAGKVPARRCGY
jgi:hypothetical protein